MQLLQVSDTGALTRDFFSALVSDLQRFGKPFSIELAAAQIGRKPALYLNAPPAVFWRRFQKYRPLLESAPDCQIFNPRGAHLIVYLKPKWPRGTAFPEESVWLEQLNIVERGEGVGVQYCVAPAELFLKTTVRLAASAASRQRASQLLERLAKPFQKSFHLTAPPSLSAELAAFSFRQTNAGRALTLTPLQLANLLPMIKPEDPLVAELRAALRGEVLADDVSLEHYATDGSVFRMKPWAVILPRDTKDLVNVVRWVTAKKLEFQISNFKSISNDSNDQILNNHSTIENSKLKIKNSAVIDNLSITCRGKATDQAGGPINEGIIVRFPGYLDKILEIGPDFIRLEPGALWSAVNDQLSIVNRFVPCYPASAAFATIGGGVANNCSGEKTVKYGSMRDYVRSLKMILADGQEVEIKPLGEEELRQKQSLPTREGEIYRTVGDLLIGNHNLIENSRLKVNKSSTGYWLFDALTEEGIDLTKIVCGSQGTLGIITEITLKTLLKPPVTGLLLASFDDLEKAGSVVLDLLQLRPSALEMVDRFLIEMVRKEKPEMVASLLEKSQTLMTNDQSNPNDQNSKLNIPAIVLLIEFDNDHLDTIKEKIALARARLTGVAVDLREAYDPAEQNQLWQVRRSAAIVAEGSQGAKKALPFIEDVTVHPSQVASYLKDLYQIMNRYGVEFSVWGHAGNGNLHVQPFLDLAAAGDREKLFAIAEEVYQKVIARRGSLSGEHNDGLMRAPFLKDQFGQPMYDLFVKIKSVFDPRGIFNPHKKTGVTLDFVKERLRDKYDTHIGSGST